MKEGYNQKDVPTFSNEYSHLRQSKGTQTEVSTNWTQKTTLDDCVTQSLQRTESVWKLCKWFYYLRKYSGDLSGKKNSTMTIEVHRFLH